MLIKFLEDVTVRDQTKRHYAKGCVVEMAADACRHWVVRKKAEFVAAKEKPAQEVAEAVVEVEENVSEEMSEEKSEEPKSKKRKSRRK